ncbi:MAG: TlpA family protein disulfide reductase, partial [Phaeodactylibacter sp.]|nr:TlpA family protein disulfide reductase [Phaeodactylibacter sp.]
MTQPYRLPLLFLLSLLWLLPGCLVIENPYSSLAPGIWRAVLELEPKFITPNKKGEPLPEKLNIQFDEVAGGELPF